MNFICSQHQTHSFGEYAQERTMWIKDINSSCSMSTVRLVVKAGYICQAMPKMPPPTPEAEEYGKEKKRAA